MGLRLRLKANYDISRFSPELQVILRAIKKYGLMVADNGGAWFIQGDPDPRWDNVDWNPLRTILGTSLEAVDVSSLMINSNSGEAIQPGGGVTVSPVSVNLGASQSQQFTASVSGSTVGVAWSMNPQIGTLTSTGHYTSPAAIATAQNVTITATNGSKSGSAVVHLQPPAVSRLASVAVSPSSVVGGNNVNVTVTLTLPAPAGGAAVSLKGSNPAFPSASVTVAGNQVFQTFSLPTSAVTAVTSVTVSGTYNGTTVVSSVLMVNPLIPGGGGAASATFVKADTTTGGSWKGAYGGHGQHVIGDAASYPSYVTVTPSAIRSWTWAASTSEVRAPQKAASTARVAACWYSSTVFTIDLNFHDQTVRGLAVYLLDWDGYGARKEKVEILDAGGRVLDSRNASAFTTGQYLVWNVSGHVALRVTNTNANSNAVLSGLFFGPSVAAPATGSTPFVKTDTTTRGGWKGIYGADGYNIVGNAATYPSFLTMTLSGSRAATWAASTSDVRALQKASSTDRVAATWYSSGVFTINLNFLDQSSHQVALYLLDWDAYNKRSQRVEVLDANQVVLDTRTVTGFSGGQYLVWNLSGRVSIRITNLNAASNAVVSGIFFR
jgi:hypothetical protein